MIKRLLCITVLLSFLTIGINYPTYVNSYAGETAGNAILSGVAGCAASEAWKGMTNAPRDTKPVPTRSEIETSSSDDAFEKCERRFPKKSQNEDFFKCLEALN